MSGFIEAFVTIDNKNKALKIADELLNSKLAACVQIGGPVKSLYWWKGKKENSIEWTLTIKTRIEFLDRIEKSVKKMHPYEVPEIISRDIAGGSGDYLEWINKTLKEKE